MFIPGREISWKRFGSALKEGWKADKLTDTAASLTFFGVLSLFPFMLFLVTLAGLIMTPEQINQVIETLARVAPPDVTKIFADEIKSIHAGQNVGLLTLGFLGAIWSASGGITSLMEALNGVYAVGEQRPFWKVRLIAIAATLGAGVAILIAALAAVVAGPLADHLPEPFPMIVSLLRLPVAGIVMMAAWAALYFVLPDVRTRFKFITPGSVAGVMLWLIASWGFSFYVQHFGSYNKTYGAIGGVIVMLMWMWISAIVLLGGAMMNAVIEQLSPDGKRTGAKSEHDTGIDATKAEKEKAGEAGPEGATPNTVYVPMPAVHVTRHTPMPRPSIGKALFGVALVALFGSKHRSA